LLDENFDWLAAHTISDELTLSRREIMRRDIYTYILTILARNNKNERGVHKTPASSNSITITVQ